MSDKYYILETSNTSGGLASNINLYSIEKFITIPKSNRDIFRYVEINKPWSSKILKHIDIETFKEMFVVDGKIILSKSFVLNTNIPSRYFAAKFQKDVKKMMKNESIEFL